MTRQSGNEFGPDEDFARLTRALRQTPPQPSAHGREAALARALDAFDQQQGAPIALDVDADGVENNRAAPQGSADAARPNPASPRKAGFLTGVLNMLKSLPPARLLAATTSVAALAVAMIAIGPSLTEGPPRLRQTPSLNQTPDQSPAVAGTALPKEAPVATVTPSAELAPADPAPVDTAPTELAPLDPAQTDMAAAPLPEPDRQADPLADTPQPAPVSAAAPVVGLALAPAGVPLTTAPATPQARRSLAFDSAPGISTSALATLPEMAASGADFVPPPTETQEKFAHTETNPLRVTLAEPVSTFAIDVDTASYAIVRQSLTSGQLPPTQAVRIEEMVNYFPYAYPTPESEAPFRMDVSVMPTPWNAGTRLVRIGIQGRKPAEASRPPLNLVFLVDTSGSMADPAKLPLLQQALRMVLPQLRPDDQVAIVAYAGSAGVVLPPTAARDDKAILTALDKLSAGGSTAGAEGLDLAYQLAAQMSSGEMSRGNEVSRILLATDGDFNVGLRDPQALTALVAEKRKAGTYLSVLGFGRGNLDDAVMQALAQNGNGIAAYIDTAQEARKVLVDQLSGALFPLADDVKIQVEWNPAEVAEYRLIGYETRALKREDFSNDKVDAGEIGAGLQVTALYEVTAPDSPARRTDPLRYGAPDLPAANGELGFLRLRYKAPGVSDSTLLETPVRDSGTAPDEDARFAAAIAGFGQLLTGGTWLGDWGWQDAIALAEGARGRDPYGYRIEAVNLMRLAGAMQRP